MRSFRGLVLLCLAVLALISLSLVVGAKVTGVGQVFEALPAAVAIARGELSPAQAGPAAETAGIIATMRVPRTVLALVVGAGLGVAGTVMQALTRNPLADTGTLGISSGAALAATLGAMTSGIVYIDPQALDALRFGQAGAVSGRDFGVIAPAAALIAVGAGLALSLGPALNMLSLGSETAASLGANVVRVNLVGYLALTLLAGAATAAAGPIAFLGLVVPHMVRVFSGPDFRWMLPLSLVAGAGMLLLADIVGRVVMRPGELQAGIVVALVGAPFFVWLVRRRKLVAL